ncbi:YkgJ family cysteine cluster protein [Niveispirillum fermenti]|uniref:YkgJ family cysteine cluster protein n=1 Tax=Niveispirillum fermenti TaxID=1233113 RepID=UPI003A8A1A42
MDPLDDPPPFTCQDCGACCAYAADWPRFTLEEDADIDRIPVAMVAPDGSGMGWTGTRCTALQGEVGKTTSCSIYADRPLVCRDCVAGDEACLMARERYGLPLTIAMKA